MFVDTHCHLNFDFLQSRFDSIMQGMTEHDLQMIVVPGVARKTWAKCKAMCEQDERLFFAYGLHPYFIEEHHSNDLKKLEELVSSAMLENQSGLVAIGEVGLDFNLQSKAKQLQLLEDQLALAEKYKLPVLLHCRKAHSEMLSMLKRFNLVGGVLHAFSGSYEMLMQYVGIGMKVGVGPVITWPTAHKTRSAISRAPISSLVLETDSPDMAVHGKAKGEGLPVDVLNVFECLKSLRDEDAKVLEEAIAANSLALFRKKAA